MSVQIHPVFCGFVQAFSLKREQTILTDTGVPGQKDRFPQKLASTHKLPDEISLWLQFENLAERFEATILHRENDPSLERRLPEITALFADTVQIAHQNSPD